jgi:hypothetical protein
MRFRAAALILCLRFLVAGLVAVSTKASRTLRACRRRLISESSAARIFSMLMLTGVLQSES